MTGQKSRQELAEAIVVVDRPDSGKPTHTLERIEIARIDAFQVGVETDDKGQVLQIADAMGYADGKLLTDLRIQVSAVFLIFAESYTFTKLADFSSLSSLMFCPKRTICLSDIG